MVTSSKVNFMYQSVTETNTEHCMLIMYISMFWCFFNVFLFSWLVFMLFLHSWSTKHPNKKVNYVMNNIVKLMSKLLRQQSRSVTYSNGQIVPIYSSSRRLHTSQMQTNELTSGGKDYIFVPHNS